MKKMFCCFILFLLSLQFFSCSKEEPHQQEILARINDYNLTLGEFQAKLAGEQGNVKVIRNEGSHDHEKQILS